MVGPSAISSSMELALLGQSLFWWPVAHFYLRRFVSAGHVLCFWGQGFQVGEFRFRVERSAVGSSRARFSLCSLMLQAGLTGAWLSSGADFLDGVCCDQAVRTFVTLLIIGAVMRRIVVRVPARALRRGGSVRRRFFRHLLVFIVTVSV